MTVLENYSILTKTQEVEKFSKENQGIEWLAIDTEFIGEKRYQTLLCLIQVATPNGLYIFDLIKLNDIRPLLDMIVDPNILKIAHAGENDYRLLHELYNILPQNVFDTQIAAGFVGYRYPISFRALVMSELQIRINKVQTVTDWERRPIKDRQLKYALDDVIPLKKLYDQLSRKINELGRMEWVLEEMQKIEQAEFYEKDPDREILSHNMLPALSKPEQLFLIRLYQWRRNLAEQRNHSKEMVLAKKYITSIAKSIHLGKDGLRQNRRISERFVSRYGDEMVKLYQQDSNEAEQKILKKIAFPTTIDPIEDLKMEMLYSFINYRCQEQKVAPDLVLPRGLFKQLKEDMDFQDASLESGWRRKILGEDIVLNLQHRDSLVIEIGEGKMSLKTTK